MHKSSVSLLCLVLFLLLAGAQSHADVWGSAWIDYDTDLGTVIADCHSDVDAETGEYYEVSVDCVIRDGSGYVVAWGTDTSYSGSGANAFVELQVDAVADTQYTAEARSSADSHFRDGYDFWDPLNYYYWTFQGVYAPDFFDYLAGSPEQFLPIQHLETGTTYAQVRTPRCPRTIALWQTTPISLNDSGAFPSLKTGVGVVTTMVASPVPVIWDGASITETVSGTQSCPSPFPTICQGNSTWTVGNDSSSYYGHTFPVLTNTFYDRHDTVGPFSGLDAAGITSCSASCSQTYSCNGQTIGRFTINFSYTKDTINGTPVTRVGVTKQ